MPIFRIRGGVLQDKNAKIVKFREVPEGKTDERVEGCFYAGDIVQTEKNLDELQGSARNKYERLYGMSEKDFANTSEDNLESMSVAELKRLAEEEEIDLGTAMKKAEIVNTIRSELQEA